MKRGKHIRGQAMIEFAIAVMMVVIVAAGILQFVEVAKRRGELEGKVRGDAGKKAMQSAIADSPRYITDWDAGRDGFRHTPDDKFQTAFKPNFINYGNFGAADFSGENFIEDIGFVRGHRDAEIDLMPVFKKWIYKNKETITVGAEVWMPQLSIGGAE